MSLLHLLGPGEIGGATGAAHGAAVAEATAYLEREAVGVRRSRGGQVALVSSTGAAAGEFLHRTSRTLDPHLHTHLVVANVAQGVDGVWSAVDSRRIHAHLRAGQGIYHARLRFELSERLGARWEVQRSGLGDVAGVDRRLRHLFSQRSADMDEYVHLRAVPGDGAFRRRGVFHATRPDKDRARTVGGLLPEWKQRAADFGFDLGDLTRVVGLARGAEPAPLVDHQRIGARIDELSCTHRWLARRDLVAVVSAATVHGATAQVVESVAASMAEAAGAPVSGNRSFEPRWEASAVARAVEHRPEVLVPAAAHSTEVSAARVPDQLGRVADSHLIDHAGLAAVARHRPHHQSHQIDR